MYAEIKIDDKAVTGIYHSPQQERPGYKIVETDAVEPYQLKVNERLEAVKRTKAEMAAEVAQRERARKISQVDNAQELRAAEYAAYAKLFGITVDELKQRIKQEL